MFADRLLNTVLLGSLLVQAPGFGDGEDGDGEGDEPGPPGPMPEMRIRPGEEVTFHCYAYSPCASLVVEGDPAKSYLVTMTSELAGGFGVDATGVEGVPREEWFMQCDRDRWCLGGFGFNGGGPQMFSHQVPYGTATTWWFSFFPMSGQEGGDITLRVDLSDGPAPVPAWAPDGLRIPD